MPLDESIKFHLSCVTDRLIAKGQSVCNRGDLFAQR